MEIWQTVTTSNYSAISNSHALQFTTARTKPSHSLCLDWSLLGNGFQRRMFPLIWGPELSPHLSFQILTVHKHSTAVSSHSFTNQLAPLYCTSKLNSVGRVIQPQNGLIENSASNSASSVARGPLPSNGSSTVAYLRSYCIAVAFVLFVSRSLSSNGYICHNTKRFWYVGFKVITGMIIGSSVFWDIMQCSPLKVDRPFGGIYNLDLQGRMRRVRNQR
jgi:hypothetical protein